MNFEILRIGVKVAGVADFAPRTVFNVRQGLGHGFSDACKSNKQPPPGGPTTPRLVTEDSCPALSAMMLTVLAVLGGARPDCGNRQGPLDVHVDWSKKTVDDFYEPGLGILLQI